MVGGGTGNDTRDGWTMEGLGWEMVMAALFSTVRID